eukprot:Tbor_TRINITY_DN3509_c0_g1::TRINITY_DN3509_c0_g1_i1::g.2842::m.2842
MSEKEKIVSCVFISILLINSVVVALHEDEQGQRDWIKSHLGSATVVKFHPQSNSIKQVYVASKEGAFGALPLNSKTNGELRWRHLLSSSDAAVCLIPISDTVMYVVTSKGQLMTISPVNGQIIRTKSFGIPTLVVHSCTRDKAEEIIVTVTVNSLVAVLSIDSSGAVKGTKDVVLNTPVKQFISDDTLTHAWIKSADGNLHYINLIQENLKIESYGDIPKIDEIVSVSSNGTVIVRSTESEYAQYYIDGSQSYSTIPVCNEGKNICKLFDKDTLIGMSSTSSNEILKITITENEKTTSIELPHKGKGVPQVLGISYIGKKFKHLYMLLKARNTDLTLVSICDNGTHTLIWTRYEGLASPAVVKVADYEMSGQDIINEDKFGFNQRIFILSNYGTIYAMPTNSRDTVVVSDIENEVARALGETSVYPITKYNRMSMDHGKIVVTAQHKTSTILVEVCAKTGLINQNTTVIVKNSCSVFGHIVVGEDNKIHYHRAEKELPSTGAYAIDLKRQGEGIIRGIFVTNQDTVVDTWMVNVKGPIVAHASGQAHFQILTTENLRVFPNSSSKGNEVRRKYPTANVLVVFHEDKDALVVTALDIISGSILAVTRHEGVKGPVHAVIVEHVVIYHFRSTVHQRYLVGVWEMFEMEDSVVTDANIATPAQIIGSLLIPSKIRVVSSYSLRPPVVASQVLQFPHNEISAIGVTTSFRGISRKQVIFATTSGHVHAVDLRSLIFGGQPSPQAATNPSAPPVTFVPMHSTNIISHRHLVHQPYIVVTSPTNLESSSHVIVAGIDLFYARISSGKAWDLLNDDFNFHLLLIICSVFAILTLAAKWLAARRSLMILWS